MKKYRKPLVFSAKMIIPVAIATLLVIRYQLNLYGSEMVDSLVEQVGSYFALYTLSILETCILLFAACFFGYIASEKAGLLKPLSFE